MPKFFLICILSFFLSSAPFAKEADQFIFSAFQVQSYVDAHPLNTTTQSTTKIGCDARAGWKMAMTGLGSPELCVDGPNYVEVKSEWISVYSAIKYK
ncbi:hypothetical protein [Vibrio rotiferianus]|uniref:hypothetical protein n=1 Tax=Vibrio rotiferianus TaxID=190895 RepID=UPI000B5A0B90|nr:hypothetical protein [Vibrio rotiferianus]ASI94176.1 hypothetical protein BSZ04_03930 [Vibrio rotiferianus]